MPQAVIKKHQPRADGFRGEGEGRGGMRTSLAQPPHVGFIPQVLLKVEVVRVLIDESEWVCLSRVHPTSGTTSTPSWGMRLHVWASSQNL
jgi:hypothetical protein